jgi:hypothetical protein
MQAVAEVLFLENRAPRFAQGVRPAAEHPLQRSSPSRGIAAGTAGFTGARKPAIT